jgi:uncharacterized membrane protein YphA (DoxX/SURF4 family)
MEWIKIALQVIIAITIFNVWIIRFGKPTRWRGGTSNNMEEEFEAYGLPSWFMTLIRFLKLTLAALLIVGIFMPVLIQPAAIFMGILMLGAIAMHIKVKDPMMKSFPAFSLLVLSCILIFA